MDLECVCIPLEVDGYAYTQWIGSLFGDCVYTPIEHISFLLGLLNIFCWMVAQLPQLYLNYSLGSAKALSKGLLIAWLLGDTTNFIGCYLNQQLPTQKFTALYYVCIDTVTLTQFVYYHVRSSSSETGKHAAYVHPTIPQAVTCCCAAVGSDGIVPDDNLLCLECSESSRLLTPHDGSSCHSDGSSYGSNSPSVRTHPSLVSNCSIANECSPPASLAIRPLSPARMSRSLYNSIPCVRPCAESVSEVPRRASGWSATAHPSHSQVPGRNHSRPHWCSRLILWLVAVLCVGVCVYAAYCASGSARQGFSALPVPPPRPAHAALPPAHLSRSSSVLDPPPCAPVVVVPERWRVLGICAAWTSGVLYFSSRVFQLRADSRRRARGEAPEGVSLTMFCITFVANLVYGVSVLLRTRAVDWQWFLTTFPFLLGSLGTMCFDAALLRRGFRDRACLGSGVCPLPT